jgi:hypothetical protein
MYSDGKVKRTLKRRSKVLETVKRETDGASKIKKNINKKPKMGNTDHPLYIKINSTNWLNKKYILFLTNSFFIKPFFFFILSIFWGGGGEERGKRV